VKTWQELLQEPPAEGEADYGPNSAAVLSAFGVLSDIKWFSRVGQPLEGDAVAVKSWAEAIAPWPEDSERYLHSGQLAAPAALCREAIADPELREWAELARDDAYEYFNASAFLPKDLSTRQEDVIDLYLYDFVGWLMAEIVAVPAETSTHFRTLLAWFQDGRFPCGWQGEWPQGRWIVY